MPSVNLIPSHVLSERYSHSRKRRWLIVGAAVWALATVPVVREFSARYRINSQREAVSVASVELQRAQLRSQQSGRRLRLLRQEVARAEKLRYKRSWTSMISTLADVRPNDVWLTGLSTDPPEPQVTARTMGSLTLSAVVHDSPQQVSAESSAEGTYDTLLGKTGPRRLLLHGRAMGLEDIYAYVDALNELGIFRNASLRSVRGDVEEKVKVTGFTLEFEW